MLEFLTFFTVVFTTFLPLVDPFSGMTIFAGITSTFDPARTRRTALRAVFTAGATLLVFSFVGDDLFAMLGITLNGLKVVGGIIFFIMGLDLLNTQPNSNSEETEMAADGDGPDIAITPIGVPLICGPGAMTNALIQMQESTNSIKLAAFVSAVVAMMAFVLVMFLGAARITQFIGKSGTLVISRVMGLLLMVIAVESFFDGVTPIIRNIWNITGGGTGVL